MCVFCAWCSVLAELNEGGGAMAEGLLAQSLRQQLTVDVSQLAWLLHDQQDIGFPRQRLNGWSFAGRAVIAERATICSASSICPVLCAAEALEKIERDMAAAADVSVKGASLRSPLQSDRCVPVILVSLDACIDAGAVGVLSLSDRSG